MLVLGGSPVQPIPAVPGPGAPWETSSGAAVGLAVWAAGGAAPLTGKALEVVRPLLAAGLGFARSLQAAGAEAAGDWTWDGWVRREAVRRVQAAWPAQDVNEVLQRAADGLESLLAGSPPRDPGDLLAVWTSLATALAPPAPAGRRASPAGSRGVKRLCLLLAEAVARLQGGLERVPVLAVAPEVDLARQLAAQLDRLAAERLQPVAMLLTLLDGQDGPGQRGRGDGGLEPFCWQAAAAVLQAAAAELGDLIRDAAALPRVPVSPVAYVVLAELFGEAAMQGVPISTAGAPEGALPGRRILDLGLDQAGSPLHWPRLAGAMGRLADASAGISRRALAACGPLPGWDWTAAAALAGQLVEDVAGASVLGPAYAAALACHLMLAGAARGGMGVDAARRLELLAIDLRERGVPGEPLEWLWTGAGLPGETAAGREDLLDPGAVALLAAVRDGVRELGLAEYGAEQATNARRLLRSLEEGTLASGYPETPEEEVFQALRSESPLSGVEAIYRLLALIREKPAASAEVINAGWLHWEQSALAHPAWHATLAGGQGGWRRFARGVVSLDQLLVKSLDAAAVHRLYRHLGGMRP